LRFTWVVADYRPINSCYVQLIFLRTIVHIFSLVNKVHSVICLVSGEFLSGNESDTPTLPEKTELSDDVNDSVNEAHAEQWSQVYDETLLSLPYRCTVCGQAFSKSFELTQHVSEHGVLEKRHYQPIGGGPPFICQICGKMLSSSFKLVEHIRVHTGEKPYCCEQCGCRFARREAMKQHKHMHLGQAHLCPVCGKTFPSEQQQREHTRRHLLGHQHQCDLCEAKFLSRSSLSRHMATHVNRKPYGCENCGAQFRRKDQLNKHVVRMHTGRYIFCTSLT